MKTPAFVPRFGFYQSPLPTQQPEPAPLDLRAVYALLTGPTLREPTARLRAAPAGSPAAQAAENALPCFTGAGLFLPHRADANLTRFSRCLLLEFDTLADVAAARAALLADPVLAPALLLLFASPRGTELRALIAAGPGSLLDWPPPGKPDLTPKQARRVLAENFNWWALHLSKRGLSPYPKPQPLSQLHLLSYDPAAWLAPGW